MDLRSSMRSSLLSIAAGMMVVAGTYFSGVAGCGSGSSGTTPPPSGGTTSATSGGLATINLGDKVVSFVPNGTTINLVTVEGEGSSALKLGSKSASVPITTTFVADSCTVVNGTLKVVCVGFNSSTFAIVDVSNIEDLLEGSGTPSVEEHDTGGTVSGSFSGGTCINCGVLAPSENEIIISSGDGYRIFDSSGSEVKHFLSDSTATPPVNLLTENFGFDSNRRLIISPEYETTALFLWAINIDTDKTYRWVHSLAGKTFDATNGLQELDDVGVSSMIADSASVDPDTGILTIGDEFTNVLLILNLNDASFDDGAGTFDAPVSAVKLQNVAGTGLLATGQTVDNVSHILFLEDEFGSSMGAVQLPTSAVSGPVEITEDDYTSADLPDPSAACTSTFGWFNTGDPHGLSLYTSNEDGHPRGLLINGEKSCLASISLDAFLGASEASGSNKVDDASGFVTFTPVVP